MSLEDDELRFVKEAISNKLAMAIPLDDTELAVLCLVFIAYEKWLHHEIQRIMAIYSSMALDGFAVEKIERQHPNIARAEPKNRELGHLLLNLMTREIPASPNVISFADRKRKQQLERKNNAQQNPSEPTAPPEH